MSALQQRLEVVEEVHFALEVDRYVCSWNEPSLETELRPLGVDDHLREGPVGVALCVRVPTEGLVKQHRLRIGVICPPVLQLDVTEAAARFLEFPKRNQNHAILDGVTHRTASSTRTCEPGRSRAGRESG